MKAIFRMIIHSYLTYDLICSSHVASANVGAPNAWVEDRYIDLEESLGHERV